MDGLALRVDEGIGLVERLRRRQPLEGRGGRRGGEDDKERGVAGERNGEVATFDWVGRRKRERQRRGGLGIEDGVDGERASVERERTAVRVWKGEKSGAMDGGGSEVEVERERDVSGERVSRIGERMRVNGRHWRKIWKLFLGFRKFSFSFFSERSLQRDWWEKKKTRAELRVFFFFFFLFSFFSGDL